MKKLIFSLVVAMIASTACFAQSHNVVTVTHDGDVKAFYGDSAFVKAMEVAENGDFVTLSSGRFRGNANITKAVTIRGAGMWDDKTDSLNIISQTIIDGIIFNIPDSVTGKLSMEGVCVEKRLNTYNWLRNAKFKRCSINFQEEAANYLRLKAVTFVNCYVYGGTHPTLNSSDNITAVNSYVAAGLFSGPYLTHGDIINCVVYGSFGDMKNCTIRNSVFSFNYGNGNAIIPETVTCYNCIAGFGINYYNPTSLLDYFKDCKGNGNTSLESLKGLINDDMSFADETAAAKYLGTDGTQIGMYGGSAPFNSVPSYPRIKKLHLSQPVDGKMTVDIAVSEQK